MALELANRRLLRRSGGLSGREKYGETQDMQERHMMFSRRRSTRSTRSTGIPRTSRGGHLCRSSQTAGSTAIIVLFSILHVLSKHIQPAEAFAAWLAEGAKCYTDLNPPEIIMNAPVKPYSDSSYPDIVVEVHAKDSGEVVGKGGEIVQHGPRGEYTLKLSIPPSDLSQLGDLQYVIDLTLSSPATLVGDRTGCEGRRAHGRRTDGVGLRIDFDGEAADETDAGDVVKVWAGWATGHEAVQLTDVVVFKQSPEGDEDTATGAAADDADGSGGNIDNDGESNERLDDAGIKAVEDAVGGSDEKEGHHADAADTAAAEDRARWAAADYEGGGASKRSTRMSEQERQKEEARKRLKEMRRKVHHHDGGHDHDSVVRDQVGINKKARNDAVTADADDDEAERRRNRKRRDREEDDKSRKHRQRHRAPYPSEQNKKDDGASAHMHHSFRHRYNNHELGMQSFSLRGYLIGCGLMASIALGLARYSAIVGKRLHKGTRRL
mmetsp:Transcript_24912/g.51008  ORF Transcript_24912/g.51008 Transcript_24912/m.51008 type:complete len:494 (+) Transcript_24912:62-1543(+)